MQILTAVDNTKVVVPSHAHRKDRKHLLTLDNTFFRALHILDR